MYKVGDLRLDQSDPSQSQCQLSTPAPVGLLAKRPEPQRARLVIPPPPAATQRHRPVSETMTVSSLRWVNVSKEANHTRHRETHTTHSLCTYQGKGSQQPSERPNKQPGTATTAAALVT